MKQMQVDWRPFFAQIKTRGLLRLWVMLDCDSLDLIQGGTTVPPPWEVCASWPAEQACPIGTCGLGEGMESVAQVTDYFARVCAGVDVALNEPAGCRRALNAWDEGEREVERLVLLAEVEAELARRLTG